MAWTEDTEIGLEPVVRNTASSFTEAAFEASESTVNGTAFASEIYVSVDWAWLVPPAMLIALGIFFLLVTLLAKYRRKLKPWKSSILATIFHGLNGVEEVGSSKTTIAAQMEKTAESIHVRLRSVDQDRALMLD
ncbi:hypothetical protein BDV19DRAFT_385344 [Aspergillus venezuelensis]